MSRRSSGDLLTDDQCAGPGRPHELHIAALFQQRLCAVVGALRHRFRPAICSGRKAATSPTPGQCSRLGVSLMGSRPRGSCRPAGRNAGGRHLRGVVARIRFFRRAELDRRRPPDPHQPARVPGLGRMAEGTRQPVHDWGGWRHGGPGLSGPGAAIGAISARSCRCRRTSGRPVSRNANYGDWSCLSAGCRRRSAAGPT